MRTTRLIIQVTKVKTDVRMLLSLFKSAEAIRQGEKDPLQWIVEQISESNMGEEWKETMTAEKLGLREEEKKPKPLRQALGAYNEARKESQEAKGKHMDGAISKRRTRRRRSGDSKAL